MVTRTFGLREEDAPEPAGDLARAREEGGGEGERKEEKQGGRHSGGCGEEKGQVGFALLPLWGRLPL